MHWIWLAVAIGFEVAGTTSMKLAAGFTKPVWSVLIFVFYGISFAFLTLALKKIEISMAYAIWSGAGTVAITAIGILYFKDSAEFLKFVCIGLILTGVVGLKLIDSQK